MMKNYDESYKINLNSKLVLYSQWSLKEFNPWWLRIRQNLCAAELNTRSATRY